MLDEFEDLLRVKFKQGGRNVVEGFDCYGLCIECARRKGMTLPDMYSPTSVEDITKEVESKKPLFNKIDAPRPFCLVLFSIRPPFEHHIGMVMEDRKRFIHILKGSQCSIEKLDHPFWKKRLRGFYTWNSN